MLPTVVLLVAGLVLALPVGAQDVVADPQEVTLQATLDVLQARGRPLGTHRLCLARARVRDLRDVSAPPLAAASPETITALREFVDAETGFASVPYCFWDHGYSDLDILKRRMRPLDAESIRVPDVRPIDAYGHWSIMIFVSAIHVEDDGAVRVAALARPHIASRHEVQCTFRRVDDGWRRVGECQSRYSTA